MSSPFIAWFQLSDYAKICYRLDATSEAAALGEARRLAVLIDLELLSVEPDHEPEVERPMLVPLLRTKAAPSATTL